MQLILICVIIKNITTKYNFSHCIYVQAYKENKLINAPNLEKSIFLLALLIEKRLLQGLHHMHEASRCHAENSYFAATTDIGEMCSSQHSKDNHDHRVCFLKILSNIRFLGRQGLALRGAGDGSNSNFVQLFKLHAEDNPRLLDWFACKTDKYASGEKQNRILKVMAQQVLAKVESYLHSAPF